MLFRKPALGSTNICANCVYEGHIGVYFGKVLISFEFGAGEDARFPNITVWKINVEKKKIFIF
jgi:hypothetical protein